MTTRQRLPDPRDKVILSLVALLKAERATRAAMEEAILAGVMAPEVLSAMAADPVPAIGADDLVHAEALVRRSTPGPVRFVA